MSLTKWKVPVSPCPAEILQAEEALRVTNLRHATVVDSRQESLRSAHKLYDVKLT